MRYKAVLFTVIIILSGLPIIGINLDKTNYFAGAQLYVGSDSSHKTIQSAIENATDGDTIYVKPGYYNESVLVNKANLTLIGNSSSTCRITHNYSGTHFLNDYAAGINVTARGVTISGFNITVSGSYNYGISINKSASGVTVTNNRITTNGNYGAGIFVNQSSNNYFITNTVNTTSTNGIGIWMYESTGISIEENIIDTKGSGAHGIIMGNTSDVMILSTEVYTSGTSSFGLKLDGIDAVAQDSKFDSQISFDIYITADGKIDLLNTSFNDLDVTSDGGGILYMRNRLTVQVYGDDGSTPLQDADIEITDNGKQIYASSGFGGSDPVTDLNGLIENIIITDRWYNKSNTETENATSITVKKSLDGDWNETRPAVDMSTSHTEYFTSSDITAPSIPSGLSVTQVKGNNKINISWTANIDDTQTYSVYTNRTGSWALLKNISHPDTNTNDTYPFVHGIRYYYRMSAWDEVPLESDFTQNEFVQYIDDVPPKSPSGLSVTSLLKVEALNISWLPNNDDTQTYSIYTNKSGSWNLLMNITHPDYYYHDDIGLIHGKKYYYRISAWDEVPQESARSTVIGSIHEDLQKPSAPLGIVATNVTGSSIELSWRPNTESDIEGYIVYMNISGSGISGPYINISTINNLNTKYTATNLSESTKYYFYLRAFDEVPLLSDESVIVSNKTKDVTPPTEPLLAHLPEYTNDSKLIVHGTTEANATVKVLNSGNPAGSGLADTEGKFNIEINLVLGLNMISVYAVDTAENPSKVSKVQNVILDMNIPFADAGDNRLESLGTIVELNGSRSFDLESGIGNYTWQIEQYDNRTVSLYGEISEFEFDIPGNYSVTLFITDHAGNRNYDMIWINISEGIIDRLPPEIIIDRLYPPINGVNISLRPIIIIPFSEDVLIGSFVINVSSAITLIETENGVGTKSETVKFDIVNGNAGYDEKNMTIEYNLKRDLIYNQTYTINISVSDLSGNVLDFKWDFTTIAEPLTPPDRTPPEVDVKQFNTLNFMLSIDGQISIPFNEPLDNSTIKVTVLDENGNEVKGDTVYVEETNTIVFTPFNLLEYGHQYTVIVYAEDTSGNAIPSGNNTFIFSTQAKEEDGALSPLLIWLMLLVIIVVTGLIISVFLLQRRHLEELPGDEDEEDEE